MKRSVVTLPDYAIGADVYQKAGSFIKKYGRTAVIIGGKRAMSAAGSELTDALKKTVSPFWDKFGSAEIPHMKMWIC